MGERKVLNKYYPPEFDARLLPRNRKPKDLQIKVRNMLPFTIQCSTCSEYIYRGRKFNSRKELVQGEDYLGIKIWRFYIRCTRCNAEITFKTDPKNGSYICEQGAKQYFEKQHEVFDNVLEQDQLDDLEDEQDDPLALLESRQEESKREMEQLEALEELRELTNKNGQLSYEELLEKREEQQREKRKAQEIEDDLAVQAAFFERKTKQKSESSVDSSLEKKAVPEISSLTLQSRPASKMPTINAKVKPKFIVKKKQL